MSQALYRRYRPETFADVIGQEHVTEPLMQALCTGRVNHAYLFSGPRGCGKTTSARILARCLNCEQGPTPTPCGVCESCVALARDGAGSVDVMEIDAASHGGVDDARDLRERAAFGPASSRYKVYIIDEAHMVTPQGFNALLKIVEEPPEHVKFIFATTEPEKVIGTIRSRTHHYPFRLVPPGRLEEYLGRLCAEEGVAVEPGVLSFVIRAGGGSVRDSLSVLDQLIAGSGEGGVTYAGAASLLGFTDNELLDGVVEAFAAGDARAVFRHVDRVIESGQDPRRFVADLLERLRDLIVVQATGDAAGEVLRTVPSDQLDRMRAQAAGFGQASLARAASLVNAGLTEMTGATAPRIQLELICARVLLPGASGESGWAARIDRLERRLDAGQVGSPVEVQRVPAAQGEATAVPGVTGSQGGDVASRDAIGYSAAGRLGREAEHRLPATQATSGSQTADPGSPDTARTDADGAAAGSDRSGGEGSGEAAPQHVEDASPAAAPGRLDTDAIRRSWADVVDKIGTIKRSTWTFVRQHAQVLDFDGQRLLLGIGTEGLVNTFRNGPHAEVVRQALSERLGVDARIEVQARPGEGQQGQAAGPGAGGGPGYGAGRPRDTAPGSPRGTETPAGRDGAPGGSPGASDGPRRGADNQTVPGGPQRGAGAPAAEPGAHEAPGDPARSAEAAPPAVSPQATSHPAAAAAAAPDAEARMPEPAVEAQDPARTDAAPDAAARQARTPAAPATAHAGPGHPDRTGRGSTPRTGRGTAPGTGRAPAPGTRGRPAAAGDAFSDGTPIGEPPPEDEGEPPASALESPLPGRRPGGRRGISRPAGRAPEPVKPHVVRDEDASLDDEDIATDLRGQEVIEKLLGGRVIEQQEG